MIIEGDLVVIDEVRFEFGMAYFEILVMLEDRLYSKVDLDDKGNAHIILKKQEFYGLGGISTLYFQDGQLKQIGIVPDWSMYTFLDNNVSIDEAVRIIMNENEAMLSKSFNTVEEAEWNTVFNCGDIYITSSLSRDRCQYSFIIRKAE